MPENRIRVRVNEIYAVGIEDLKLTGQEGVVVSKFNLPGVDGTIYEVLLDANDFTLLFNEKWLDIIS